MSNNNNTLDSLLLSIDEVEDALKLNKELNQEIIDLKQESIKRVDERLIQLKKDRIEILERKNNDN